MLSAPRSHSACLKTKMLLVASTLHHESYSVSISSIIRVEVKLSCILRFCISGSSSGWSDEAGRLSSTLERSASQALSSLELGENSLLLIDSLRTYSFDLIRLSAVACRSRSSRLLSSRPIRGLVSPGRTTGMPLAWHPFEEHSHR